MASGDDRIEEEYRRSLLTKKKLEDALKKLAEQERTIEQLTAELHQEVY